MPEIFQMPSEAITKKQRLERQKIQVELSILVREEGIESLRKEKMNKHFIDQKIKKIRRGRLLRIFL